LKNLALILSFIKVNNSEEGLPRVLDFCAHVGKSEIFNALKFQVASNLEQGGKFCLSALRFQTFLTA